jgi:polyisoprenoid-binding protein YceI
MTRFAPALGLFFVWNAFPASAQEMVLQLDPGQTHIEFSLGATLHTVHGMFKLKRGELRIDPVTGKATGELIIDATSGDSGNGDRDRNMHRDVLESVKFREITLTPDRFEGKLNPQGDSQVQLHGQFGIHGSQHEITLPVRVRVREQQLEADTQFPVPYPKWGMKNPSTFLLHVADTVQIHIHAVGRLSPLQ